VPGGIGRSGPRACCVAWRNSDGTPVSQTGLRYSGTRCIQAHRSMTAPGTGAGSCIGERISIAWWLRAGRQRPTEHRRDARSRSWSRRLSCCPCSFLRLLTGVARIADARRTDRASPPFRARLPTSRPISAVLQAASESRTSPRSFPPMAADCPEYPVPGK
jgi:hypothetical protein